MVIFSGVISTDAFLPLQGYIGKPCEKLLRGFFHFDDKKFIVKMMKFLQRS